MQHVVKMTSERDSLKHLQLRTAETAVNKSPHNSSSTRGAMTLTNLLRTNQFPAVEAGDTNMSGTRWGPERSRMSSRKTLNFRTPDDSVLDSLSSNGQTLYGRQQEQTGWSGKTTGSS